MAGMGAGSQIIPPTARSGDARAFPNSAEELVQAIAGDVHAFYVLYDRAARLVRAVAADPGPDAAEDVTHDIFVRDGRSRRVPSALA
jgi:DNA-directed RNA polymerase specialized sigma24 family protein